MTELAGKKAIVTGGTRGIGFAAVQELAGAGASVAFTGTMQAGVDAAQERLGEDLPITGRVCDVRNEQGMRSLLTDGCDILVNNAAVGGPLGLLHTISDEDFRKMIDVTLFAAVQWARHAAAGMLERGGGTIINVSSGAAHHAVPNMGIYCTAKAGLSMASQVMHLELAESGIRVFCFEPGVVDTNMQTAARESGLFEGLLPSDRSQLLQPEVPARAIRWLCSHGDNFAGRDLSVRDEALQKAMSAFHP